MDEDFLWDSLAIKRATKEGTGWLAVERYMILKTFETRLRILFSTHSDSERFASLTRQSNLPHSFLQVRVRGMSRELDTIMEEWAEYGPPVARCYFCPNKTLLSSLLFLSDQMMVKWICHPQLPSSKSLCERLVPIGDLSIDKNQ